MKAVNPNWPVPIIISCLFVLLMLLSACGGDDAVAEEAREEAEAGTAQAYISTVDLDQVMSSPDYGVQVFDVSDPFDPRIVEAVDTPGRAKSVSIFGRHAYVAAHYSGLQVIELASTGQFDPLLVGRLPGAAAGAHVDHDVGAAGADQIAHFSVAGGVAGDLPLLVSDVDVDDGCPRIPAFYGGLDDLIRCNGNMGRDVPRDSAPSYGCRDNELFHG